MQGCSGRQVRRILGTPLTEQQRTVRLVIITIFLTVGCMRMASCGRGWILSSERAWVLCFGLGRSEWRLLLHLLPVDWGTQTMPTHSKIMDNPIHVSIPQSQGNAETEVMA